MAAARTCRTRIAPHFAAAAARATGPAKRHLERYRSPGSRLMPRERDFCAQRFDHAVAIEGVTHAVNLVAHGRKIDCDLVGKRVVEFAPVAGRTLNRNPRILDPPLILHEMHLFVA